MKGFKIYLVLGTAILSITGCNVQNAINSSLDYEPSGTYISDFGGNVALAATTENSKKPQPLTLSEYTTKFNGSNANRLHNIKKASSSINGIIIQPGEVFSFNDTIGPTEKKTGFLLARIFVEGKDSEGYGGGVCQVSSTLYNAADDAGLTILERHPHSKAVTYVAKDRDAATSYGYKDLKFMNSYSFPVMIGSRITKTGITVSIELA